MASQFINSFVGLFVAMDIIGTLPLYLGMTQGLKASERRRTVDLSIFVAAGVALVFGLLGKSVFKLLGIALFDFKVGGGIVLLVMAILDLVHTKSADSPKGSTGVVPLAVPLITGPGLITAVMLQVALYGYTIVLLSLLVNFAIAWASLRNSSLITKVIGVEGANIVSKIAALLMTAIAFSMIRSGIFEAMKSQ